ncbi:hypothetical protein C4D60_Mb03t10590 [Musa balbisiana]|uniref:Uncharacterized protein n=1 Tax=Musa balbisiana TaxID=52838 RepID=A0A4S8J8X5_MUSBA|nr:hypothetical protein C4D60_Mb03t10590 [Musa balbisiana]
MEVEKISKPIASTLPPFPPTSLLRFPRPKSSLRIGLLDRKEISAAVASAPTSSDRSWNLHVPCSKSTFLGLSGSSAMARAEVKSEHETAAARESGGGPLRPRHAIRSRSGCTKNGTDVKPREHPADAEALLDIVNSLSMMFICGIQYNN